MRITNIVERARHSISCPAVMGCLKEAAKRIYNAIPIEFLPCDRFCKTGYEKWRSGKEFYTIRFPESFNERTHIIGYVLERKTHGVVVYDLLDGQEGLWYRQANDRPDLRARYVVEDLSSYFPKAG